MAASVSLASSKLLDVFFEERDSFSGLKLVNEGSAEGCCLAVKEGRLGGVGSGLEVKDLNLS